MYLVRYSGEARLPCGWPYRWSTHLDEVPALVQAALDLVTVKELGQPTLGVVHQATGVGEERSGPQGSQVQKAFLGVSGELGKAEQQVGVRPERKQGSGVSVSPTPPSALQSWLPSRTCHTSIPNS